jgi:hypothetical protein
MDQDKKDKAEQKPAPRTEQPAEPGGIHLGEHAEVRDDVFSGGQLVVNPGSVGLPAYADNTPVRHKMESGSPHARYAVLTNTTTGWRVELVAVPYDWEKAADRARVNGRNDWAARLESGRP